MKRRSLSASLERAGSRVRGFVRRSFSGPHGADRPTSNVFGGAADASFDARSTVRSAAPSNEDAPQPNDLLNYAVLIVLYTLQGIPMGLSASIPFLLQEKMKKLASLAAVANAADAATATNAAVASSLDASAEAARLSYNANAIFSLCSWPFSLKLLWAPVVDSLFFRQFGRRKTWLVPVQTMAGIIMVAGADFVERQLGLGTATAGTSLNVKGVTAFFFVLYFLMATQDIAVDGWALTMLSKKNRGRGPVCNSIGQNIGYFLSFVGFLALNDVESSERYWRPLFRLPSDPTSGVVSLGGFIRFMGFFMLLTTTAVAIFKREYTPVPNNSSSNGVAAQTVKRWQKEQLSIPSGSDTRAHSSMSASDLGSIDDTYRNDDNDYNDEDAELDASEIGLKETYRRLWAVCQLSTVQNLFFVLLTYRLSTVLSDNVKFLKAVEYGLSKSTTALLSPILILPLGILVPIAASKFWHVHPLRQFTTAYKLRVTIVPILDLIMLSMIRQFQGNASSHLAFWIFLVLSTAMQAICNSLQFNSQMVFFASRVDPAIGGSYMTLLNTASNLGGTWPTPLVMWLIGKLTLSPTCHGDEHQARSCEGGRDPYLLLQAALSAIGIGWLMFFGPKVRRLAEAPDEAWRTHTPVGGIDISSRGRYDGTRADLESADVDLSKWSNKTNQKHE